MFVTTGISSVIQSQLFKSQFIVGRESVFVLAGLDSCDRFYGHSMGPCHSKRWYEHQLNYPSTRLSKLSQAIAGRFVDAAISVSP